LVLLAAADQDREVKHSLGQRVPLRGCDEVGHGARVGVKATAAVINHAVQRSVPVACIRDRQISPGFQEILRVDACENEGPAIVDHERVAFNKAVLQADVVVGVGKVAQVIRREVTKGEDAHEVGLLDESGHVAHLLLVHGRPRVLLLAVVPLSRFGENIEVDGF